MRRVYGGMYDGCTFGPYSRPYSRRLNDGCTVDGTSLGTSTVKNSVRRHRIAMCTVVEHIGIYTYIGICYIGRIGLFDHSVVRNYLACDSAERENRWGRRRGQR